MLAISRSRMKWRWEGIRPRFTSRISSMNYKCALQTARANSFPASRTRLGWIPTPLQLDLVDLGSKNQVRQSVNANKIS